MMAEYHLNRNGWIRLGALTLAFILTFGIFLPAGAQESAPRTGIWVDFLFGTGIDKETRAVIGEGTTFVADGERVYCMTRIHGMSPPTTVTHAWYHEGTTMAKVDLAVGSENWRTWSSKSYLPTWTGSWEVKVLDQDGMVLGTAGFEVK